jgi:hypothetical protein
MLAPYEDPEWQIWACSTDNAGKLPRVDAWFEIHGDLGWENPPAWEAGYIAWLNDQDFDLYVQLLDLFPKGIKYPKEEIVKRFGPYWFTSTFAWMMALAITKKPEVIGLFGVDMAASTEYYSQRPALVYFSQVAAQDNIAIYSPPESDVLQPPPLYGYSVSTPKGRKLAIRAREIRERLANVTAKRQRVTQALDQEIHHLTGSLDDLDYIQSCWTGEFPKGMDTDA